MQDAAAREAARHEIQAAYASAIHTLRMEEMQAAEEAAEAAEAVPTAEAAAMARAAAAAWLVKEASWPQVRGGGWGALHPRWSGGRQRKAWRVWQRWRKALEKAACDRAGRPDLMQRLGRYAQYMDEGMRLR